MYNLKADPKEINNLASNPKYHKLLSTLRQRCDELVQQYQDPFSRLPEGLKIDFEIPESNSDPILPVYSWKPGIATSRQNAYQVLVSSSEKNIELNIGDVWNSGQVKSNQAENIKHAGNALATGREYFWKVRIWDQDNRLTEYTPAVKFNAPKK